MITYRKIVFIALSIYFLALGSTHTAYASTRNYPVTEGIAARPAASRGEVFFNKNLSINYSSGKIILAGKNDGTGNTFVDDGVRIRISHADGSTASFAHSYQSSCSRLDHLPPKDITSLFEIGTNTIRIELYDICGVNVFSDPMYLVNTDITDSAPAPFLDLPWDYEGQEKKFENVALKINSYFDHSYPLLGGGLGEPFEYLNQITTYENEDSDSKSYSRHDGYDYGTFAGVKNGDPVLPAAPGVAEYVYDKAGGHAVFIDHGNGYQTRYYHLQDTGLITKTPGVKVPVDRSTIIGKVGSTGEHTTGPHIHIGVFQDKNGDGNFDDNIPDGATDPFGWQPDRDEDEKDTDPWENYSFLQNGVQKTGNKSYYLWKKKLPGIKETVTTSGGTFKTGDVSLEIKPDTFTSPVSLNMHYAPSQKASDSVWSIGPVISVTAKNTLGDFVTLLTKPVKLIWLPFRESDLSRFKTGTFYLYSTKDGGVWKKEQQVDPFTPGNITATTSHFTYFAIMGERKDTTPPVTTIQLYGEQGQEDWFRTDVQVSLNPVDNEGSLGVNNTQYKIDDEDWQPYSAPFSITEEGHHKIQYYSQDNDGNLEDVKTIGFDIDKTAPEAKIQFDLTEQELVISGVDSSGQTNITITSLSKSLEQVLITDKAGNTLLIEDTDKVHGPNSVLSLQTLSYNDETFLMDKNKFSIEYQEGKTGEIKSLVQVFEIKGQVKVKLDYDPKKNKTTIIQDKQKADSDGMKLLQITTDKGILKYSY
jgi:murein DD-endopeptidase MepM/ murein hydrolase activator NlpD